MAQIATTGVSLMSSKPGGSLVHKPRPMRTGLLAGALFGLAAIGFRGGILTLPDGGLLIRATTIPSLSLTLQTGVFLDWMLAFDHAALRAAFGVWRSCLGTDLRRQRPHSA